MRSFLRYSTIVFVIVSLTLVSLFQIQVSAMLTILPPEKILDEATLIATGEVVKLEKDNDASTEKAGRAGAEGKTGTIKVDGILKGSMKGDTLVLKEKIYMTSALLQGIPPVGTRVLVLLGQDEKGVPYFFSDSDHIGIIKDDRVVEVYKGINVKIHPYVQKYDEYYQAHKAGAKAPDITPVHSTTPVSTPGTVQALSSSVGSGISDKKGGFSLTALGLVSAGAVAVIVLMVLAIRIRGRHN